MGATLPHSIACEFKTTNNEAEYVALIAGKQLAKGMRIRYLQIYVDSLLIANHFNSSYAVKCEKLIKYLDIVKDLAESFDYFNITQIPRKENAGVDALANLASALKLPEDVKIPIIHVLSPVIEECKAMEVDGNLFTNPEDHPHGHSSWILLIRKYIQDGEIPKVENPKAFKAKVS
ncbi:uncharacterized protein LOC143629172 [Bidens hawaiensis]|uniref:uncharacterized protein LOC143629172 n=1 Tax=Bidens hawaiensis TaxID=980011 RepID=UPI00404B293B